MGMMSVRVQHVLILGSIWYCIINRQSSCFVSVDLLHSPTITITADINSMITIVMIKRKNSSMITLVMVTVVMIDLSRVKTPFLLPATLRGSCLVMKSAKFQIISPKSFQTMLLINHTVCRR